MIAAHLLLLPVLVILLPLVLLAHSQAPRRAHRLSRRAPEQGQSLCPEVCAQAEIDQRPEAGVNVAKLRRDHHGRFPGVPRVLRFALKGVNDERDVVRRPAEEEDGHQADDREGPRLLEPRGAAAQSQRDTSAAGDQNGCRQQKAQQVVEEARHQLPDAGRCTIELQTPPFIVAGTIGGRHKHPLGANEDEGADPDAQTGHMSRAGSAR